MVVNDSMSTCREVRSGISQICAQCSLAFFENGLDGRIEGMFIQQSDITKLGEGKIAKSSEVRLKVQRDFDRLKHWPKNIFNNEKYKVLNLGGKPDAQVVFNSAMPFVRKIWMFL